MSKPCESGSEKNNATKFKSLKIILIVLVGVVYCAGAFFSWSSYQPKFHDLTIELGTDSVRMADFMNWYAFADYAYFISDPSGVNIDKIGKTKIDFGYNQKKETVSLTVQDTVAPKVSFVDQIVRAPGAIPEADEFVSDVEDLSPTRIYYEVEPSPENKYNDLVLTVVVGDEGGNIVKKECLLKRQLLKDSVEMEYGDKLSADNILIEGITEPFSVSADDITAVNSGAPGEYIIHAESGEMKAECTVYVVDKKGPSIELKNVDKYVGDRAVLEDFLVRAEDPSGVKGVAFTSQPEFTEEGEYTVTVTAEDNLGNISTANAKLTIRPDTDPPVFKGLSNMNVKQGEKPNYTKGVSATDAKDGNCKFTYNVSNVNLKKVGTYYINYSASDSSGNVVTAKRKITVTSAEIDVAAELKRIAASLPDNDPLAICKWIRKNIPYTHGSSKSNPVGYILKNKKGDCYVHAKLLEALLKEKGIENKIIYVSEPWLTTEPHYWNLVKTSAGWRHLDSTPTKRHPDRLMTDADRLANLQGRDWDHSKWPACN